MNIEEFVGEWEADVDHSELGFVVRHSGISKVKGKFSDFNATAHVIDEDNVIVTAIAQANSFTSGNESRDAHVKSADFLDVDTFPTLDFKGNLIQASDENFVLRGDLTIHGITHEAEFDVEYGGSAVDPYGNTRVGVEATTVISRKKFGLTWNTVLETGGVLVSDKVNVVLDLSFIKKV